MSEKSPYWNWVRKYSFRDDASNYLEYAQANPDVLSSESPDWGNEEESRQFRQELLKRFAQEFNKLTKRQKEVVNALDKYKTQELAATKLDVTKQYISLVMQAVRKKLSRTIDFCHKEGY